VSYAESPEKVIKKPSFMYTTNTKKPEKPDFSSHASRSLSQTLPKLFHDREITDLPVNTGNLPLEHIVIIGGGVIGCCTAYYLTQHMKARGISVTMVESTSIACGASGSNF
jgi:NADPH-dependent 2,4-dienoyl-CoA reductase/sulfur reductase-like enzyme